jgi:hypothetical protein
MAILVDRAIWRRSGRRWAHLATDADFAELHRFAEALGIPRRGFHADHYDLPEELRAEALQLGALSVNSDELVRRLQAAGLRRRRSATPQV